MIANLFYFVFKPIKGNIAFIEDAQVIVGQKKEAKRFEQLVKGFTIKVPELKFSLAKISSFLLEDRKLLEEAINNIEQLILKLIRAKSKLLEISTKIA